MNTVWMPKANKFKPTKRGRAEELKEQIDEMHPGTGWLTGWLAGWVDEKKLLFGFAVGAAPSFVSQVIGCREEVRL